MSGRLARLPRLDAVMTIAGIASAIALGLGGWRFGRGTDVTIIDPDVGVARRLHSRAQPTCQAKPTGSADDPLSQTTPAPSSERRYVENTIPCNAGCSAE